MQKKLILASLLSLILTSFASCNSKSEEYSYTESSSVLVSAFSLKNDKKVLDSLSNVFFTIDLEGARIFNADSLPFGTKVRRLIPSITTASSVSAVQITYRVPETGRDTVVNYLKNPTDSIDFSGGPVKLSVTSQNGHVTRDYEIRVNVHQVKSDSLAWYSMQSAPVPTSLGRVDAQCTARLADRFFCLTAGASGYCLAVTDNPADPDWQTSDVSFPFTPDVESLRASDSMLYILDTDGNLHSSADGTSWTPAGCRWISIFGGFGDDVIGVSESNGLYRVECCPSGKSVPLPDGMPCRGVSLPAVYRLPMGYGLQAVIIGGSLPDGSLTDAAWSYDGQEWARCSNTVIPHKLRDMTLVPYSLSEMRPTNWAPSSYPVLLAMGGRNATGAVNRTIYYSRDWGMNWSAAPSTVQLPAAMTSFYGAQAFTYSSVMHASRAASGWTSMPVRTLQPFQSWEIPALSRAVAPITEWECPAVYVFGGRNPDGETLPVLWRGVILQYTFKPVQ